MTQTLDVNERISQRGSSHAIGARTSTASTRSIEASRFGTFAITFGIAFAVLYTVLERLNWPLFSYFPATGRLFFWLEPPRPGEGPPMYWYGWLALSLPIALVLSWVATMVPALWLRRVTVFCCVLAALWPGIFVSAVFYADWVSFDVNFLKSIWLAAIPALVIAAAASYFASSERAWISLLLIAPLGGLLVLGYSLIPWFVK